ncbi:hypothetical protein KC345_g284 [Hortaea werneckii]|nr:hypothetical protein KC345_g284 [Hortaea werneckii]
MTSANLLSLPTLATILASSANAVQGPAYRVGMVDITILSCRCTLVSLHRMFGAFVTPCPAAICCTENPPLVLPEFAASSASVFQTPRRSRHQSFAHPQTIFALFQVPTLNANTYWKVALDLATLSSLFHRLLDGLKVSSCVSNIVTATVKPSLGIPCNPQKSADTACAGDQTEISMSVMQSCDNALQLYTAYALHVCVEKSTLTSCQYYYFNARIQYEEMRLNGSRAYPHVTFACIELREVLRLSCIGSRVALKKLL